MPFRAALLLALLSQTSALKAGDFFKICHKSDPNLNECIKESLTELRPSIKSGIPQLRIAPLDPMVVPKISVTQGSGPVSIDSTFFDLKIHGISNYNITKITTNLDKFKIDIEAKLPYLYNEGGYSINGKVLVLPITGKGASWSNYTDVDIRGNLIGSPITRGGKKYMKLNTFKFDLAVKKAVIHMDNLFNGNKELGNAMNRFMTENWEAVFKELKPVVNEAVSVLLKDVADKVFDRFTVDELFPA